MRKIKNFKINFQAKEITRVVKKLTDAAGLPVKLDTVQRYCRFYAEFLTPAVVYKTFSKEEMPFVFDTDTPEKWIAGSVFFATVGDALYNEYAKNKEFFGEYTGKIVSAVSADALERSKNFAGKLISDEARKENCEVSKIISIPRDLYELAARDIPADKIGISVDSQNLTPRCSACGLFYWIPSKKKAKK